VIYPTSSNTHVHTHTRTVISYPCKAQHCVHHLSISSLVLSLQEKYKALVRIYYRGAAAAIVTFDVSNKESFTYAQTWVQDLQMEDPTMVIVLAANKSDLGDPRAFMKEAKEYAASMKLPLFTCSAKTGENVKVRTCHSTLFVCKCKEYHLSSRGCFLVKAAMDICMPYHLRFQILMLPHFFSRNFSMSSPPRSSNEMRCRGAMRRQI